MKKLIITSVLAVLAALMTIVSAQKYPKEYLGLPGDNLNLYAVMDLFRNSPTLEAFERSLNERDSRINNLDLNRDNRVDYITVSDYRDGKVHTIVLRAVLGRREFQDVAVITVEKLRRKKVMIQLIGDVALYGRNYIIEPVISKKYKSNRYIDPVYYGNTGVNYYYHDIYEWPVVVYISSSGYSGWHSSYYWGYYPTYWDSWSPYYWDFYYGYHSGWHNHYYSYYHHSDIQRYRRYNDFYYHSIRQESPEVRHRIDEGNYRQTYSRPEQRSEGAALYTRTRPAVNDDGRSRVPAGTVERREAAPQSVSGRTTSTGSEADRRIPSDSNTGSRTDSRTTSDAVPVRRSPAAVSNRAADPDVPAGNRDEARRVSNDVENREVAQKAVESRAAESRATEARAAQNRAAEARASEQRAAQDRAAQSRAAEQRAAESRAAEARASEQRAAQNKAAEQRAAESRAAESRAAEVKASEQRAAQERAAQERASQERAREARAAEERAATARRSEIRDAPESGTARSARK